MHLRSLRNPVFALVALVLTLALAGTAGVAAQGTTQTSPPPDLSGAIAQGTCDAPGQASILVGDFVRIGQNEIAGSTDIEFTLRAQRNVDSTLDALFGSTPYVFIVTDNANPGGGPVACGALGGVNVNGQITVALTTPDQMTAGRDLIVGVAVFGATTPAGPTTQPAAQPGQLPVQAYLSEDALRPAEMPMTVPTQQETSVPASPTAGPTGTVPVTSTVAPPTSTTTETATVTETATATETATVTETTPPNGTSTEQSGEDGGD